MFKMNAKTTQTKFTSGLRFLIAGSFALSASLVMANPYQSEGAGGAPPSGQTQTMQPKTEAPAPQVSNSEMDEFVQVQKEFQKISDQYESALGQAGDPNQAGEIQSRFQQKMAKVIEKSDLSAERYNEIRMAITSNSNLQKQYLDRASQ